MPGAAQKRTGFALSAILMALAAATGLSAQDTKPDAKPPERPAVELVREAVANEVTAANSNLLHMFRSYKKTPKGSQTRLYVETKDAVAAMMIATDDQPLTAEQQQAELGHLSWLVGSPEQLRKKHAREKEDDERSVRILKALPDAFLYEYAGSETGTQGMGAPGDPLVKLNFKPNPAYSPPSRIEQALEGMQGELLIDTKTKRLAKITATLFREIAFGWGIIGHLDKGGHFLVKQGDLGLGDGSWGISEINLDITGRILLLKSLKVSSDEILSDYRKMPNNLTFAQGVEILKAEQAKLAHNAGADQSAPKQQSPVQKADAAQRPPQ